MAILKQIKFGTGTANSIAQTKVKVNENEKVLTVTGSHTGLDDANDPEYTLGINIDGKTVVAGESGLETGLQIAYVAAANNESAKIQLQDNTGTKLSEVLVSDIVANSILDEASYDSATGVLTLTFKQADGTNKTVDVDLKAMLDIDDVVINENSTNYLEAAIANSTTEDKNQLSLSAKIGKVETTTTDGTTSITGGEGLADAKQVAEAVKTYVEAVSSADKAAITSAIQDLDAEVESADGNNFVKVKVTETDGKLTNVSVTTADIAKASELSSEVTRAKGVEESIGTAVGLTKSADTGTYTYTPSENSKYIKDSTSVADALSKIDTQLANVTEAANGIQYQVDGTTLTFFGITEKANA